MCNFSASIRKEKKKNLKMKLIYAGAVAVTNLKQVCKKSHCSKNMNCIMMAPLGAGSLNHF